MAPKKKGRANKLARMTDEEKLRYLQHKAAMEEEAQRRKQELILTFMKNKMVHEEAFSRINSAKINQQWRRTLRQIKCKELKEDVETMKQKFEVGLECKNKLIKDLLSDFEDAEFQYTLQYQTQMEIILKFLELHKNRLLNLEDWFKQQIREVLEADFKERVNLKNQFDSQISKLRKMYDDCMNCSENRTEDLKSGFNKCKNDLQTKLLYSMVKMEEKYTDEIRKMDQCCKDVLKNHTEKTETKTAHYNILANKDDNDVMKISDNFNEISKLIKDIKELSVKYEDLVENNEKSLNKLKEERENVRREHRQLRENNEKQLAADKEQLKYLTEISNRTINNLKNKLKKGVHLLQILDMCRKLCESKTPHNLDALPKIDDSFLKDLSTLSCYEVFWKKYTAIEMRNEELKQKKMNIIAENEKLKQLLHNYMVNVRRSSSVPRNCGI